MSVYCHEIRALIDPEQAERCPRRPAAGRQRDHDRPPAGEHAPWRRRRSSRSPREARELAFELLALAEHAERIEAGDDRQDTRAAAAARRARRAAAPAAAALRPQRRAGGDRHRRLPALGARRGPARPAGRGGRRPRPGDDRACAAARSGLPAGKTFDAWDEKASPIPKATQQALRTLEWVDRAENALHLRPERDRQEPLRRGARAPRDRPRQDRRLAHPGVPGRAAAPPPRRRQRHQGDRPADPRRPDRDRRRRHAPGLPRRRRGAVPRRRRRLRETLARDHLQHPPGRASTS